MQNVIAMASAQHNTPQKCTAERAMNAFVMHDALTAGQTTEAIAKKRFSEIGPVSE